MKTEALHAPVWIFGFQAIRAISTAVTLCTNYVVLNNMHFIYLLEYLIKIAS